MEEIKTGLYRHFKGGTVFVYGVEKASEDGACPRVGYVGMQNGQLCSRPVDDFDKMVKDGDGKMVPRFSLVKEIKVDMQSIIPKNLRSEK